MQNENVKNEDLWPGSIIQCWDVLLNAFGNPKDSPLLYESFENDEFLEKTKNWSSIRLVNGAIFCLFEYQFENFKEEPFTPYLWKEFFLVSISPKYSIELLMFARDMQYFKKSPKKAIFEGFYKAIFSYDSLFSIIFKKKKDLQNLENILYTLNVPESDIIFLMTQAFETKSFKGLLSFLEKRPNDFSINEAFLLDKILLPFSVVEKNKKIAKDLETLYAEFIDEKKTELEAVDVFDVFTSGEDTKARVDVFNFLFFYQTFCLEFYKNKSFCLNLFLIFENYVVLEKKANTTIANLTKKELFFEITNFCIAKKDYISSEIAIDLPSFDQKLKQNNNVSKTYNMNGGVILLFLSGLMFNPQPTESYIYNVEVQPKVGVKTLSKNNQQVEKKNQVVEKKNQVVIQTPSPFLKHDNPKVAKHLQNKLASKGFKYNNYQFDIDKQLTVYNSLVYYNQISSYKKNVSSFLDFPHPTIEFDHLLNKPFCKAVGFRYNEGLTVSRPSSLHHFLTRHDKIEIPDVCGYGPERGTIFQWVEDFFSNKLKNIELFYQENYEQNNDILKLPNLSQTLEATKQGIKLEVARLNRITTPHELILVVNDFITFCQKATREAENFKKEIPLKIQSGVQINEVVEEFKTKVKKCEDLYAFHNFLCKNISKNSFEYFAVQQEINHFNYQLKQNVECLIHFEGKIAQKDKEYMLKPAFTPAGSWQDLEKIANNTFGFKNRTQGLKKTIFYRSPPNSFNRNLGVLDDFPKKIDPSYYL